MSLGGGVAPSDKELRLSMIETLRLAWADEDLRARLKFVLMVLTIYAVGIQITVPIKGIDLPAIKAAIGENAFFQLMNTIGGGAVQNFSIFLLGLGPYIIASIIIQVVTMGNPKWKEEMKEGGEYARKQQNKRTRVLTLALCVFQGWGLMQLLQQATQGVVRLTPWDTAWALVFLTAGAMLLLWLGEQVSEKGVGNGVSILIFAGIVIGLPNLISTLNTALSSHTIPIYKVVLLLALFLAVTWGVVYFTVAQRRIPIQHMRRNFGTKAMGGQTSYLPFTVAMAGVIPIIFALTLLYMPAQFMTAFPVDSVPHRILGEIAEFLNPDFATVKGWLAILFYTIMIFIFTYFWTAMQYNVEDIADNLKRGGSYIQGIRPGKQTRDFLNEVISRVTFVGAAFLAVAALTTFGFRGVIPEIPSVALIGGTSLLIMVSVALETMRQIEANLITKQYEQR